ncbi:MAG: tyrosine-type recombinase/integrase [Xanthobacteraceae bacterium]
MPEQMLRAKHRRATAGLPERRSRRRNLTDKQVAALPRKRTRYAMADPEQRGLYLRVPPQGPITFAVAVRDQYGRKPWVKLGDTGNMGIEAARDRARTVIRRIKDGLPAFEPVPVKPASYQAVAEKWLELHVAKEGLRSGPEIERLLRNFVFPFWGKRDFVSIKRRDISELLDSIEKDSAWNADHVLAIIRKLANWYATRDEDYTSPFVKGMRRTRSEERERDRILNDDELRRVWRQAEANGTFGALVRVLLLTAQRRGAVVGMKSSDIKDNITPKDGDKPVHGIWEVATTPREKGNFGAAKLPEKALAIIQAQPKFSSNPYVFAAARGNGPLNGFNKRKAAFDKACGVTGWTLHDLRRTARSLMSRAGITDEHAEHTLGHKLQGVKRVYNRYDFFKEKSDALVRLAALIDRIVNPPADNVVLLQAVQ